MLNSSTSDGNKKNDGNKNQIVQAMRDIKDFIHLYLGCECQIVKKGKSKNKGLLYSVHRNGACEFLGESECWQFNQVKPILRPLKDMNDEEYEDICCEIENTPQAQVDCDKSELIDALQNYTWHSFEICRYLLSKHFDLFGLIESGAAIDKTKKL